MARAEEMLNNWETRLMEMNKPLSEFNLKIEGSPLEKLIKRLFRELDQKGIIFKPKCYLTDSWGCPNKVPVIGIPFYYADPNLAKIEDYMQGDLEDEYELLMSLRHEAGHAINYAYRLFELPEWQDVFGRFTVPYRDYFTPKPQSRDYVKHLFQQVGDFAGRIYAQKHPDEDFAETFAVWMTPRSGWRRTYAGWSALKKLEYVDELMWELAGKTPPITNRREIEPLPKLRKTLRQHYAEKRKRYGAALPDFADRDLKRLFSDSPVFRDRPAAATFLRRVRSQVSRRVARTTGAYQYAVDQVLEDIINRCRGLRLRLTAPEEETMIDFAILLAVHTMSSLTRRSRVAM